MLRSANVLRCASSLGRWQGQQHHISVFPAAFAGPQFGPSFLGSSSSSSSSSSSVSPPQDIGAIRYRSNRSRRGLYDGKDIRTGNNVSFSMRATKRKFKPNVFQKRVYSEILEEMIRFHLTASTLRSIDKAGGLDNYLLTSDHVQSGEGKQVKERILNKLAFEERQRQQGTANNNNNNMASE